MLTGNHFYNHTLKKSVSVFGTVFNNLRVVKHGGVEERVPISYGPRDKFLARLAQESRQDAHVAIKLPRMAFEITDLSYDTTSSLNKMNFVATDFDAGVRENGQPYLDRDMVKQSVPYTLGIDLNIISKTQDEALQVLEQILPTFMPEYTVAIKDMHATGVSSDVPIILNSVNIQQDYEGDFETRGVIIYTLSFTMKINFIGIVEKKPLIRSSTTNIHADLPPNETPLASTEEIFGFLDDEALYHQDEDPEVYPSILR